MNDEFDSIDGLVSDILATTNIIGKILFNRHSILLAAVVSLISVVLVLAF
jgi:hypothetical protein